MFLMYVDESGDPGLEHSTARFFVLSSLVIHELRWTECLDRLVAFRRRLRRQWGIRLREEIHSSALINNPGPLHRIRRNDRLTILRTYAGFLGGSPDFRAINVVVDKQGKPNGYDVFESAWKALIQRFENTIAHGNFEGFAGTDERGAVFPDYTNDKKLTALVRRMRRHNPVPHQSSYGPGARNLTLTKVVEDPNYRDSEHSFFIQSVDAVAYLLPQYLNPNAFIRRKGARQYFLKLKPILCTHASSGNDLGVVHL